MPFLKLPRPLPTLLHAMLQAPNTRCITKILYSKFEGSVPLRIKNFKQLWSGEPYLTPCIG